MMLELSTILMEGYSDPSSMLCLTQRRYSRKGWEIFHPDDILGGDHICGKVDWFFFKMMLGLDSIFKERLIDLSIYSMALKISYWMMCDLRNISEEDMIDPSFRWCVSWVPYLWKGWLTLPIIDVWTWITLWFTKSTWIFLFL